MRYGLLFTLTLLLITACSSDPATESATPYRPSADIEQLMYRVLDPGADMIWLNSGWVIDKDGERDLFPKTDAEWQVVINGATIVTEAGNLLMMPGRENGADGRDESWIVYSQAIIDTGNQLIAAAEAHDEQAIFDLGGQLYNVCKACHLKFIDMAEAD